MWRNKVVTESLEREKLLQVDLSLLLSSGIKNFNYLFTGFSLKLVDITAKRKLYYCFSEIQLKRFILITNVRLYICNR